MTRPEQIQVLVDEWKAVLSGINLDQPEAQSSRLLMLVAEEVVDLERRLEFFNGHTHSTQVGGMMGFIVGAPEPRKDI